MTTKKNQIESILVSVAGVAAMFFILVAFYIIAGVAKQRFDFTSEKLYTLSDGTKAILNKMDTPVEIRLYCTQHASSWSLQVRGWIRLANGSQGKNFIIAAGTLDRDALVALGDAIDEALAAD